MAELYEGLKSIVLIGNEKTFESFLNRHAPSLAKVIRKLV